MRFFTASLIALSTLAAAVLAQENPITYPSAGDKIEAGSTVEIKWTPTSDDKEVTLVLRVGDSAALGTVGPIVENTENDGSYTWTAPDDLVAGQDYAIQIVYSTGSNYSPQFEIDSTVTAPTTTATTATATATETETSTATEESSTETSATETETTTTEATTTDITTTATTNLISTITPSPNATVTTLTTKTTTTKPRTTSTNVSTGAPDPGNAAGLGKTVSGGLVVLVAAAWALML